MELARLMQSEGRAIRLITLDTDSIVERSILVVDTVVVMCYGLKIN